MKKRILSLVLTFAMLSAVPMSVSAETLTGSDDWTVSFDGSKMESNFKSADLDEVIYDMQPGDTAQFQVALTNKHGKEADWYMSNDIVISMEDSTEASGGAYEYLLTYTDADASGGAYEYLLTYTDADGTETTIFSSEMVGGEDTTSGEGLHKVSDALGEMFYLSRLASGASGTVKLEVKLDGETLGNDYQNKLAQLEMQFAAEEAADDQIVTTRVPGDRATTVKTGDNAEIMLYISLAALAVGLIILILVLRRMRDRQEEQAVKAERRSSRREDR